MLFCEQDQFFLLHCIYLLRTFLVTPVIYSKDVALFWRLLTPKRVDSNEN